MLVLLGGVRWPFGCTSTGLDALVHGGKGFEILGRSKAGAGFVVTDVVVGLLDSRVCRGRFGCGCCRWGSRSRHGGLGSRCCRSGSSRCRGRCSSRSGGGRCRRFGWCHRGLCQRHGRGGDKNGSNQRVFKHVQFFQRRQKCHALSTLDRSCALTKRIAGCHALTTAKPPIGAPGQACRAESAPCPCPAGHSE